MNGNHIQPEVGSAAQRWFVRLQSRDCSAGERETFERWRCADPVHDQAYRAVEDVWRRSAAVAGDPALGGVLRRARHLPPERSSWLRRAAPALAMAACLILAVGMGYYLWWLPKAAPAVEYVTQPGQQRTLALKDGSKVVLDTASELRVQYDARQRRLTLLHGQADFQVSHDAARPFVVHVGNGTVTATGTRFQVRAIGDVDTVTLLRGQVIVAIDGTQGAATDHVTLHAGERVAIRSGGRIGVPKRLTDADLAHAQGWTKGLLVVRGWPLARLLAEMNRYGNTPLRLGDPGLGTLQISGSFKVDDQKSFLLSLEYIASIRVTRDSSGGIVLRRK